MTNHKLALGRETDYPDKYAPEVLDAIPRAQSREPLGITAELPFAGVDVWNAWELTWLGSGKRPAAATARIVVPVESPNIIESKSLKLYLNSFAMTEFDSASDVAQMHPCRPQPLRRIAGRRSGGPGFEHRSAYRRAARG